MYWYVSICIDRYWSGIVMYLVVLVCSFIKCPKNGQITRDKWQTKVEIAKCKIMYWFVFICISMYYCVLTCIVVYFFVLARLESIMRCLDLQCPSAASTTRSALNRAAGWWWV